MMRLSQTRLLLALVLAGALASAALGAPASAGAFALKPGGFKITPSTQQAGAHEDLTTTFKLVHNALGETQGNLKTTSVELPAGFVGSDTAMPTCGAYHVLEVLPGGHANCPADTQIGTISFALAIFKDLPYGVPITLPLYNMEVTNPGVVAEFGFNFSNIIVQLLPIKVRPNDLGLTVTSEDITGEGEISEVSVTVWGVPTDPSHDPQRGQTCNNGLCTGGGETVNVTPKPFLANPTSCPANDFSVTLKTNDWQEEASFLTETTQVASTIECERVPFQPSIEAQPSATAAESPTGLDVSLLVPQTWEDPETISTANLMDTTVTLPEGMTANPSLAAGLGACTPGEYAQYEKETFGAAPVEGCPSNSKIGSIEIETPLLAEKIPGAIYIATPYDNPFPEPGHPGGSLLALYVVGRDRQRGVVVKVAGRITPNPVTGRLVTTFDETPQQPFSKFTLQFRPGGTAPLVTPPTCGSYAAQAELTPWSAPGDPRLLSSPAFQITQGANGGACPSGGVPPFNPQVVSGTLNNAGGSYSPFYLRIVREDGEQELTKFSTTLPPGLTGNLNGIPFCPEADIEAARAVSGTEELEDPSCPAASEIGHTIVEAGVGNVLAQTPGKVYLAGPYHGAPLSIVSITSATVGPFDLGTVVIRFALDINPITAQVEVSGAQSDPIPHIIKGIVVHVRDIRVYMNREKFIENPTNCESSNVQDAITGAGANYAEPADQDTVNVNTHFEAADCASLGFKPAFTAVASGKTSKANGTSLHVAIAYPKAAQGTQANIREVKVELPKQLPSRLSTLQKACTAKQFDANPAGCPAASIVGHAKAVTPILPVPLEGPAYFVSYGAAKFPELVLVLQGYGITIDLHGETFISKAGITSSTFKTVPDQPVSSFELTLPEGQYSALTNNGSLCNVTHTVSVTKRVKRRVHGRVRYVKVKTHKRVAGSLLMPTSLIAQNGAEIHQSTVISVTGCGKAKAKSSRRSHQAVHGKHEK
jgi:hypothetical protein